MAYEPLADFWNDARRRVAKFRAQDPDGELVFGANGHRYATLPTVSESRLQQFEADHEVLLPKEYRSFLQNFGAGGAGPDYGIYDFASVQAGTVSSRFPLTESQGWPEDDDDPLWQLPGLLTISTSGCAIDWFLEVNGPQPGTMWVDAGPGEQLMRCESFRSWYSAWLGRIEFGLDNHHRVRELVQAEVSLQELQDQIQIPAFTSQRDGRSFLRFRGVPGEIGFSGQQIVDFQVGTSWIL